MYKTIGKIGAFLYCAAIIAVTVVFTIRDANRNLKRDVVVEAGSNIRIEDFFERCPDDARFVTDVSTINTDEPAVYKLKVFYDEVFEKDVVLRIEDHTAPRGVALPQSLYTTWKAPEAADCVGYLYDLSGISKIEYEEEPLFKDGGDYNVPVLVTDVYGNTASIDVPFTVIDDRTGPVLTGVHALETEANSEPDFFEGVTVNDDYDEDPVIRIDDSKVDYETPGTYEVKYIAVDKANNFTTKTVEIKVKESTNSVPAGSDSEYDVSGSGSGGGGGGGGSGKLSDAKRMASRVLSGLWGKDNVATARNIFNWVHNHISYAHCGSLSYASAAYRGFSRRSGDCYVFYSCSKMLLDLAGIPNMMVKRYPVYGSNHYWNLVKLNGQWYHCDSTRFKHRSSIYFMCTDEQINDKYHQFNGRLYPARAGGSKEFMPSDTPTPTETPTPEVTETPTPTPTPTPEISVPVTPTPTGSAEPTVTGADTPTPTPETTQNVTVTPTPKEPEPSNPTDTPPPTSTPTNTPMPPPPTKIPEPNPTETSDSE